MKYAFLILALLGIVALVVVIAKDFSHSSTSIVKNDFVIPQISPTPIEITDPAKLIPDGKNGKNEDIDASVLQDDTNNLFLTMGKTSYFTWTGSLLRNHLYMNWKLEDGKLMAIPAYTVLTRYHDKELESYYLKKISDVFTAQNFVSKQNDSFDVTTAIPMHYRGFEKGDLKCQISWSDEVYSSQDPTLATPDFNVTNGKSVFYAMQTACGAITPQTQEVFNAFYTILNTQNNPLWLVYAKSITTTFAAGTAGILGSYTGEQWLAKNTNQGWKIILTLNSDDKFTGDRTTQCLDIYKTYQVPTEFQIIPCT
ncbi:MAG TPA: hypothetical protein VLI92_01735 [Candidatus Saccharimonadales bacterium]|nr:hypothetical protein [Candidatus Saccharimonadales bacterium]